MYQPRYATHWRERIQDLYQQMCIRDRLVSVRSGARQSMPGMMDTILNRGLNDEAVEGLAKKTCNARFAYDCYRRFVQMFADVVMMVPKLSLIHIWSLLLMRMRSNRWTVFRPMPLAL